MEDEYEDLYLTELIGTIVAQASIALTLILQQNAIAVAALKGIAEVQTITGIHYMYGFKTEIAARLIALESGGDSKFDKYPLVWLETPAELFTDRSNFGYKESKFNLHILNGTIADYIAPQRIQNNFMPILRPIKKEILRQITDYSEGLYKPFDADRMSYSEKEWDYWGKQNAGAGVLDFLDCIELCNLNPRVNLKNC